MRAAIFNRRRSRAVTVGAGALALSLVATSAGATVLSGDDPIALANAMVATATATGATLAVDYPCVADDPTTAIDEGLCPTGVGSTPMAGFPTNGSTFTIITSGNAALADDANVAQSSGYLWNVPGTPIGPEVFDYQVLRVDLGAATGNCVAFDFRFLSEEFDEFINSGFNDAFIAQLNSWAVSVDPASQAIIAPGNFAAGAGDAISVDGAGPSAMSAPSAAGTTYDGATLSLIARTPVTPGATNTLYLTIFDQGDDRYDSAAFVDNLRYETLAPGQCKSLAVDPFEGVTGVVLTPGTTGAFSPNLATFTVPLTSKLPTGPIATNITGTASFLNWGDVVPRTSARTAHKKVTTALGSGSTTIPAGGSGNLVLTTTPAGIAAVRAAQAKPATLLAQAKTAQQKAKKFTKKAKKLKKQAKKAPPTKAKKLIKKAKKLKKKAKKAKKTASNLTAQSKALSTQPLGTVVVTITNPSNAKSELLRIQIPR